jgi:hypothetical protein
MKNMKYSIVTAIIYLCSFWGCKQLTRSIEDTLHPHDTVTVRKANKEALKGPDIESIIDSQIQVITSVVETHTSQHIEIHVEGKNSKFLSDSATLDKAEQMLRQLPQYAGKEMLVYQSIHFYDDGTINIMLQHPDNPAYADKYSYAKGKWSEPAPVQLSAKDDMKSKMVPLDKISFTNAFKVAKIYNKKALQVEGARPATSVYISIWNNQIRWFPATINGSRERWSINFNENGTLSSFSRD